MASCSDKIKTAYARPGRARDQSPAGCIEIGEGVAGAVAAEIEDLLKTWPTADVADEAWRNHGWTAIAGGDEEAVAISDDAASEHLEIHVSADKLDWYLERLVNCGSLFLGEEATVAFGDKGVGTSHVLPTSRAARYTGGLWVGMFLKTCTYQRLTAEGTLLVGRRWRRSVTKSTSPVTR